MIVGVNKTVVFQGVTYHVQIEDLPEDLTLDVRIYVEGQVLLSKQLPYKHLLGGDSKVEDELRVQEFLVKNFKIFEQGVLRGRLAHKLSGAGEKP